MLNEVPHALRHWEWKWLDARLQPLAEIHQPNRTPTLDLAHCVGFLPSGDAVFGISGPHGVVLRDLRTGDIVSHFSAEVPARSTALSDSGTRLAAVGESGSQLWVWDIATGAQLLATDRFHDVRYVRMSAAGDRISFSVAEPEDDDRDPEAGGFCSRVVVLDVESGQVLLDDQRESTVRNTGLSPSGSKLAVGTFTPGRWGGELELFSLLQDGARGSEPVWRGQGGNIWALSFDPTERQLVVAADLAIQLLETEHMDVLETWMLHRTKPESVKFSGDGRLLVSSSRSETIVWDVNRGQARSQFPSSVHGQARFGVDNTQLVVGDDLGAQLWDLTAESSLILRGHESYVYTATFSPDGSLAASSDWSSGSVRLWDAHTGDVLAVWSRSGRVRGLAFTTDGSGLVECHERRATVIDLATGRTTEELSSTGDPETQAELLEFYWQRARPGSKSLGGYNSEVEAESLDGFRRVQGTSQGFNVTHTETRRSRSVSTPRTTHPDCATPVAVSPDASLVAVARPLPGQGWGVQLHDPNTGAELRSTAAAVGRIFCLAFSPDRARMISGGEDQVIRIWHTESLELLAELRGHQSYVHSASFSPDGTRIISASGDGTVRIWDSVAPRRRWTEVREAEERRDRMRPRVARRVSELESLEQVAAELRADASLDENERRAALRVLLENATAESP